MSEKKQGNEQRKKPADDDTSTSTTTYITAESKTSVNQTPSSEDENAGVPLTRLGAERKSQFRLIDSPQTNQRSAETDATHEDGGVPLSRLGPERKSHFQLFAEEPAGSKTQRQFAPSTSDISNNNDDDDEDDELDNERERKVTKFNEENENEERVGVNRAKRFSKTKSDHRSSGFSDESSSDMHMKQEVNRGNLDGRRSGSLTGRNNTNLDVGKIFIYVVVPPDGGYGWFIMVISFLCQVIVDGLIFSIGIVMPHMASDLQVTQAEVVLVVSVQVGCYFLSGPISSAMINKYGFRPVILVGTITAALSVLIATFSPNLPMLIAFYSIIGGPTLSMIWVTSQLIIGYYFEKYRPIAYGLSVSGAGAGIVFASALNSAVVDNIGWRNTLRIHAGLLTIIIFMGITFVEVPPTRVAHINETDFETETDESEQLIKGHSFRYSRVSVANASSTRISTVAGGGVASGGATGLEQMLVEYEKPKRPNCCARCCGVYRRVSRDTETPRQRLVVRTDFLERQDVYYMGPADYEQARHRATVFDGRPIEIDRNRRTTQYTLSVLQAQPRATEERRKTLRELKETSRRPCLAYISPSNWMPAKIVNAFKLLFDFRLLAMAEFQILLASAFFFPMGFNIPFVYSRVRAEIAPELAILISPSIGASNFLFRIVSGFIAFKYQEYTTYVCGFGLIFGGVATFTSAFYGQDVIWFQFVYAVCYGVAPAFYSTLRAIIYVKALGLEKLTNAFGLTGMAMGLGVFLGTTLAGTLNEFTDSYSASFAFGGCCMIIAGTLKVLLPPFMRWKESRLAHMRKVQFT